MFRIKSDFFCIGVFILPMGTVVFPKVEKGAEMTIAAFLSGYPILAFKTVCEKYGWEVLILEVPDMEIP